MLRKRCRSHQKDHLTSDSVPFPDSYFHSDVFPQSHKNNSFFNVPALFVGFNPKSSESDSVRSPTSPLDLRVFSNISNCFRYPRPSNEGYQKSWDSSKVGLSIIDSLCDDTNQSGKFLQSSDSKYILFGPQTRIKTSNFQSHIECFQEPKSLPSNVTLFPCTQAKPSNLRKENPSIVFEIGEAPSGKEFPGSIRSCSLDSGSSRLINFGNRPPVLRSGNIYSGNPAKKFDTPSQSTRESFMVGKSMVLRLNSEPRTDDYDTDPHDSLSASEIELSEDYTCVRTHGPNPKITHIFGSTILECDGNELTNFSKNNVDVVKSSEVLTKYPSDDFLSFCCSCKKKLDGKDIYMYRGEKAFCSSNCRSQEILIDEEIQETNNDSSEESPKSNSHGRHF